jgi:hypothetical protein
MAAAQAAATMGDTYEVTDATVGGIVETGCLVIATAEYCVETLPG